MLYRFFKNHSAHPLVATLAYAGWLTRCRWKARRFPEEPPSYSNGRAKVKIGVICDQMTYDSFRRECQVIPVTPRNWRTVLLEMPPDLLLCESAWSGIKARENCWRGRIYRNHHVLFEHRKVLFDILKACGEKKIPTVFWNKEDPTFFGNRTYDFVDTALHFDYIFTTAKECIPEYERLGHRNVHLLQFGFSPELFNPVGSGRMKEQAFFAGSWYQDQPERCRDMRELFQFAEDNGIPYTIYDRNESSPETLNRFPEAYRDKVRPPVPFAELSRVTKQYRYALNVNTVKDSETMFARRVYEMMAENHIIISNRSRGLEQEFPQSVWYCGQKGFPNAERMRRENLEYVFRYHTYEKRLNTILQTLDMTVLKPAVRVRVFLSGQLPAERIPAQEFPGVSVEYRSLDEAGEGLEGASYAAVWSDGTAAQEMKWDFLLAQFAYLPSGCGVRWGKAIYEIVEDTDNWNCIFPVEVLGPGLEYFKKNLKKLEL